MNVRLAALAGVLAIIVFGPVRTETAAAASKKYSCESCSSDGVKATASTALGPATKSSGCRVRKGSADLPMYDPACTPSAFNPTVTTDILRSGRFRTGCVRNCVTTQAQKQIVYERYGVHKDRATGVLGCGLPPPSFGRGLPAAISAGQLMSNFLNLTTRR